MQLQSNSEHTKPLLGLFFFWAVMVALSNPFGNFPLNDDWVYALTVRHILENGQYVLTGGSNVNLFSHAIWGTLFCLPFGFSFDVLRLSSLVAGFFGVCAAYFLFLEVGVKQKFSLWGAVLLAMNPIYFAMSNTFMTDVSFTALFLISALFLIRGLKGHGKKSLWIGFIFAVLALLNRQLGLALFAAFSSAYVVKYRFKPKAFLIGAIPSICGVAIQVIYQKTLQIIGAVSLSHNQYAQHFFDNVLGHLLTTLSMLGENFWKASIYFGLFSVLFTLPFFVRFVIQGSQKQKVSLVSGLVAFGVILGLLVYWSGQIMPLLFNVLTPIGIGPFTIRDSFLYQVNLPPVMSMPKAVLFWKALTFLGVLGAAILFTQLFVGIYRGSCNFFNKPLGEGDEVENDQPWLMMFFVVLFVIYFFPVGSTLPFDRYFLPLIPVCMLVVVMALPLKLRSELDMNLKWGVPGCVVLALGFGFLAVASVHDYLSWNQARWKALNDFRRIEGAAPTQIDGGYEYNGWFLYDPKPREASLVKSYWWVHDDQYMVGFGEFPSYRVLRKYPVQTWLPASPKHIYALERAMSPEQSEKALIEFRQYLATRR